MPRGHTRYELILLFDKTGLDAKNLKDWLDAKGVKEYSTHLIRLYYAYYLAAKDKIKGMI